MERRPPESSPVELSLLCVSCVFCGDLLASHDIACTLRTSGCSPKVCSCSGLPLERKGQRTSTRYTGAVGASYDAVLDDRKAVLSCHAGKKVHMGVRRQAQAGASGDAYWAGDAYICPAQPSPPPFTWPA